ncbi:1316_t:CDS:2 [Entrophospora sp. SA101]|nr:1316_t:CDS:2 [Entrophospora sp. SA101]
MEITGIENIATTLNIDKKKLENKSPDQVKGTVKEEVTNLRQNLELRKKLTKKMEEKMIEVGLDDLLLNDSAVKAITEQIKQMDLKAQMEVPPKDITKIEVDSNGDPQPANEIKTLFCGHNPDLKELSVEYSPNLEKILALGSDKLNIIKGLDRLEKVTTVIVKPGLIRQVIAEKGDDGKLDLDKIEKEIKNFTDPHVSREITVEEVTGTDEDGVTGTDEDGGEIKRHVIKREVIRTYTQIVNNSKNLTEIIEATDKSDNPKKIFEKILNPEGTAIDIAELKNIVNADGKIKDAGITNAETHKEVMTAFIELTGINPFKDAKDGDGLDAKQFNLERMAKVGRHLADLKINIATDEEKE